MRPDPASPASEDDIVAVEPSSTSNTVGEQGPVGARMHSATRIAQSAWFVVSVYLGLMLVDLVQNGIFPSFFVHGKTGVSKLILQSLTLILFVVYVAEAFVWLNPMRETALSGKRAVHKLAQLALYVIALLFIAFLSLALTNEDLVEADRPSVWFASFSAVLWMFMLYNLAGLLRPESTSDERAKDRWNATYGGIFYGGFAAVAAGLAGARPEPRGQGYAVAIAFFSLYFIGYFALWWRRWHAEMYAIGGGNESRNDSKV